MAACGQLQNQAYGYLFPMGPFFLLGTWRRARLGGAAAVVGAGAVRRVPRASSGWPGRSGVRVRPGAASLAGFAYALSPRMLTALGPISVEAWPGALAPWVLVPLVRGLERLTAPGGGAVRPGRALVGGVNAAATFAVLPLGGAVAAHPAPGPRRRRLMLWWPLLRLLGTLWWLVPLLVLGRYSPPFLDCIESRRRPRRSRPRSSTRCAAPPTGCRTSTPAGARGQRPDPAVLPAVDSGVVLLLGLVGLLHRRNPHRAFLSWACCSGCSWSVPVTRIRAGVGSRWACRTCSTACSRRCETCTSSTPCSACRWCWGSGGWSTTPPPALRTQGRRPRPRRAGPTATASRGARYRGAGGAGDVVARPHRAPDAGRWTGGGSGLLEADCRLAGGAIGPGSGPAGAGVLVRRLRLGVAARRADAVHGAQPMEHPQRCATGPRRQRQDARRDRGAARAGEGFERAGGVPPAGGGGVPGGPQRPCPAAGHPRPGARAPGPGRLAGPGAGRVLRPRGRRRRESDPAVASASWSTAAGSPPTRRSRSIGCRVARRSRFSPSVRPRSSVGRRTCWTSPTSACSTTGRPFWPPTYAGEDPASPLVLTDGLRAVERNFGRVHDGASATLVGRATPSACQHRTGLPAAGRRPVVHLGCAGGRRGLCVVLGVGRHCGWDHAARPAPLRRGRRPGGHVLAGQLPHRRARLVAAPAGSPPRTA